MERAAQSSRDAEDFRGRRVLVVGAGGFVGARLVGALLRRGADVHGLVRPSTDLWRLRPPVTGVSLHAADLADRERLLAVARPIEPEVIFFAAGEHAQATEEGRWQCLQVNVAGRLALLELAREGAAFVGLGTSLEYGGGAGRMREDDPAAPRSFYGAAMAAATVLSQYCARAGGRVAVLRPFVVYGPRDKSKRFLPTLLRAALRGEEVPLTAPGVARDWVHVDDVVEACLAAAARVDAVRGEVVNVGSGRLTTNEEVVAAVEAATGRTIRTRVGEHPGRPWEAEGWVADLTKARERLGWEPRHGLREGVARTVAEALADPEALVRLGVGAEAEGSLAR